MITNLEIVAAVMFVVLLGVLIMFTTMDLEDEPSD